MRIITYAFIFCLLTAFDASNQKDALILRQISDYMQTLSNLSGDFTQISPSGAERHGKFYISLAQNEQTRRARLTYTPPDWGIIIANNEWLSVQDTPTTEPARYPIRSSPITLLLDTRIRIDNTPYVSSINRLGDGVELVLTAPQNKIAGTLHLFYHYPNVELRGWRVRDAQGQITSVYLSNVSPKMSLGHEAFMIKDPKRIQ